MRTVSVENEVVMADDGTVEPAAARRATIDRDNRETVGDVTARNPRMRCRDVSVFYGDKQAIHDVSMDVGNNEVIALIGPSGCGKSTFLRCLNRMNDTIDGCRVTGNISLDGESIYDTKMDVVQLRAQVGMVFQKPNPFPKTVFDNIAYGPRLQGITDRAKLDEHLKEVQAQGYAIDDEEYDEGIRCVGVPIRDYTRRVIAALSISGPSYRFTDERLQDELIPLATTCGTELSKRLGFDENS